MNQIIRVKVPKDANVVKADAPTNHILSIDCSGSMAYDLPRIRQQLKNKIPTMVKKNDTVTLSWFSGRGQFGFLTEAMPVNDLMDLKRLNDAVDRWLRPMGLTGFLEPLKDIDTFIGSRDSNSGTYSLMFLTDGCDNQWAKSEIIKVTESLGNMLSGAVFVEYGYYCNHPLLEEMASAAGGSVVFAEDFDSYEPIFDSLITRGYKSSKKIEIQVENPMYDLVFSMTETGPVTYRIEDGKVYVNEDTEEVFYFSESCGTDHIDDDMLPAVYQGLSVLALRRKSKFVRDYIAQIGDTHIFNKFANCFGKQNLYDFQKLLLNAAADPAFRFIEGKSGAMKVDPNAFTVIDLLFLLQDSGCLVSMADMKYSRIGRKTQTAEFQLTDEEKKSLMESLEAAKTAEEYSAFLEKGKKLIAGKQEIKFTPDSKFQPIIGTVWNSNRPNVSMQFRIAGSIILPEEAPGKLSNKKFDTFIYRNYTMIRDGLLNIEILPVVLTQKVFNTLRTLGVVDGEWAEGKIFEINMRNIPLINDRMVSEISADEFFRQVFETDRIKAAVKVYAGFKKEVIGEDRFATIKEIYGENIAKYLEEIGVTDQGFAPKVTEAPATDVYIGTELEVKAKGFSTIPSFNAFKKKIDEGKKLNAADMLLYPFYQECLDKKAALTDKDGVLNADEFAVFLLEKQNENNRKSKENTRKLSETMFSIIVGQAWFKEFETIENCSKTIEIDGNPVEFSVGIKDVEIKI